MKLPFATLDVFTNQRFAGNPLAVVLDADALDDETMQAIAREFGYPETAFLLKPAAAGSTARVRIFTPGTELAFAGHPTVGAALILGLTGHGDAGAIVLEEKIGTIQCTVTTEGTDRGHARFIVPDLPRGGGAAASRAAIAAALGLSMNDIGSEQFAAPARWSVSSTFTFVPLRNLDMVRRCHINEAAWDQAFELGGQSSAYVFCSETVDAGNHYHARMFAPRLGVAEDAATGSAAAAFAGLCARTLPLAEGENRFVIEQGYEMGRPSLIELTLLIRGGKHRYSHIGGPAVVVAEGVIEV